MLLIQNRSVPVECRYAVYVDDGDDDGNNVSEQRFLPFLYFQSFACIGFTDETVPAPADPVTAEESEYQRAERQDVCGNYEIPEVQPGRSFGETELIAKQQIELMSEEDFSRISKNVNGIL